MTRRHLQQGALGRKPQWFYVFNNTSRCSMYSWTIFCCGSTTSGVIATVVATLIASIISSIVAWFVGRRAENAQAFATIMLERSEIYSMISKITEYGLVYPIVEDERMTANWPNVEFDNTDKCRYQNYCCFVFNTMERAWKFADGNVPRMNELLHTNELISTHSRWWRNERENLVGYDQQFRNYVDNQIAQQG